MNRYFVILCAIVLLALGGCATHQSRALTEDEQQALRLGHTVHADTKTYPLNAGAEAAEMIVQFGRALRASQPLTVRCTTLTGYRKGAYNYHTTCY